MKPWYDNYCFAVRRYGKVTMYNSNIVLYFIDNYVNNDCEVPDRMIDDNIRTDYNKLRMLIRRDKEFAHDASIIQQLVQQGYITGTLKPGFPAEQIGNPDNFISLLFYFGMVTIDGTYKGNTKFVILVHGFTLAMTCQNQFYRPISEKDTQEGYADIFLCPLLDIYSDMTHSYIVELKYAKAKDTDAHIQQLAEDAKAQVSRYAQSEVVTSAVKTTQLHKIVVIYRGTEMVVCEEVA